MSRRTCSRCTATQGHCVSISTPTHKYVPLKTYTGAFSNAIVAAQGVTMVIVVAPPDAAIVRAADSSTLSRTSGEGGPTGLASKILDSVVDGLQFGLVAVGVAAGVVPAITAGSTGLKGILVSFNNREIRVVVGVQLEKLSMNLLNSAVQLESVSAGESLNFPLDGDFSVAIWQVISSLKVKIEVKLRGSVG